MVLFKKFSSNNGSVLLEALLSIMILSVSVVLINQSLTSSLRALVYSEDYTKAMVHLENKMFEYTYLGYIEDGQNKPVPLPEDDRFQMAMETMPKDLGQGSKLNQLGLNISWKSGKRKNNIVLETYLFPPSDEDK